MNTEPVLYSSGEEIHAGDRVLYRGNYGRVVFVTDGDSSEALPGYEDYSGYERGIIISDDDGTIESLSEANDELVFVDRS